MTETRSPELLSDQEITALLPLIPILESWLTDLKTWALAQAMAGRRFEGHKLVAGRSIRAFTDPAAVRSTLLAAGFTEEEIQEAPTLLSLAKLESKLGKKDFAELLSGFVTKPPGKPTLVEVTDKRPEITVTGFTAVAS